MYIYNQHVAVAMVHVASMQGLPFAVVNALVRSDGVC